MGHSFTEKVGTGVGYKQEMVFLCFCLVSFQVEGKGWLEIASGREGGIGGKGGRGRAGRQIRG